MRTFTQRLSPRALNRERSMAASACRRRGLLGWEIAVVVLLVTAVLAVAALCGLVSSDVTNGTDAEFPPAVEGEGRRSFHGLTAAPDGETMLAARYPQDFELRDLQSGQLIDEPLASMPNITVASLSADGQVLAAACLSRQLVFHRCGTASEMVFTDERAPDIINCVAVSPTGSRAASGSDDGTIGLWSTVSGRIIRGITVTASPVEMVLFSPDDRRLLATLSDGTVCLWDIKAQSPVQELIAHRSLVKAAAFSSDSRRLATGDHAGTVQLWDVANAGALWRHDAGVGPVLAVAFAPDARTLSVAGGEQISILDEQSGQVVAILVGHDERVSGLAYTPDGRRLHSCAHDGTLRLWDLNTFREIPE